MWKLHVENPLHEEDGVGVEVQPAAGLPHHRVVGVGIQEDRDVPAAHQHLGAGGDGARSTAVRNIGSQGPRVSLCQALAPPSMLQTRSLHLPLMTTLGGRDYHLPT